MILGMPVRIGGPATPWIAGQIGTASDRLVAVSSNGTNWSSAPTYATGLTSSINKLLADNGLVLASTGSVVRRSLDGGLTWGAVSGLGATTIDGLKKSGSFWVVSGSSGNGIYRSSDGTNWTTEDTSRTFYDVETFGSAVIVGSTNATIQRSTDNGDTWANISTGTTAFGPINYVAATSSHIIVASGGGGANIRRSSTGLASSWSTVAIAGMSQGRGLAANTSGDVLLIDSNRNTFYSNDSGATWTAGPTIGSSGDVPTLVNDCVSFGSGAWMIATYDGGSGTARIWRATNPAGPWTEVGTFTANGAALGGVRYIGA